MHLDYQQLCRRFSLPIPSLPPPPSPPPLPPYTLTLPTSPQPLSSPSDCSRETAASEKTRNKKSRHDALHLCCLIERETRERRLVELGTMHLVLCRLLVISFAEL
ncbi:hypothetical protein NQZ68_010195 [Dissostichus eleginoides]|nr:hypothetical protein NQZ68_010195 [Dissostichus eleginoides]